MNTVVQLFKNQRNSKQEFVGIVAPHVDIMYRMAFRWTGNQADAEDLLQDVLIKLASRVKEMQAIEKLRPWLIKLVYHRHIDLYRKHSRSPLTLISDLPVNETERDKADSVQDRFEDRGPDHAESVSNQELLSKALSTLPDEQKDVILLHDLEGYSALEVAEILGISPGTVKSRLHRCRDKLKKILSDGTFSDSPAC